jgi:ubiquitin-protein ligase
MTSTTDENEPLRVICKVTGGSSFRPFIEKPGQKLTDAEEFQLFEQEGLKFFEQEAFLNLAIRDRVVPYEGKVTQKLFDDMSAEFFRPNSPQGAAPAVPYDTQASNHAVREANQTFPLGTLLYGIRWGVKAGPPVLEDTKAEDDVGQHRFARVLRELKYMRNKMPNDSIDYQAWVNYQRVDKLRVFFRGPPGSPYAGKWWSLYITFPSQYPASPPVFRFVNVPYHPNISAEGRVLFSELDRAYTPDKRIWDLIVSTRNLLGRPETDEPLNKAIGLEFVSARANYDNKGRAVADREGAATPDWPYTAVRKYGDDDNASVADEGDDTLESQLSMTRTKPVPITIDTDDLDIYD